MARPHSHSRRLSFLLRLLLLLPAATAAPYSSLCHSPAFAADVPGPKNSLGGAPPVALPSISTGHFSGGGDLQFAPAGRYDARAFFFDPRESSASATTDPAVTHLSATLTLEGARLTSRYVGDRPHSVSFDLDGYYSTATGELCMVGTGSYAREDGFGVVLLSDVVLRLIVPRPSNLTTPFVTGRLGGVDFNQITLVAYAEGDYEYGEVASCPPTPGTRPVLPAAGFSCGRLRRLLGRSSYSLEYRPGSGNAASGSPLRLRHGSMYINQLRCGAADGAVRAYIVFYTDQPAASPSSYTARRWGRGRGRGGFLVGDEALVADGFWDSSRSRLCLRACRVASSSKSSADMTVGECGIGVSFWFPAVWSVRDRSAAKGMIWNASGNSDGDAAGVISASRTGGYLVEGDLSGIKYNYTRVEEAKKHYDTMPTLSKERKGRFPGNYSYRDFAFRFSLKKQGHTRGYASPVTIGSALVQGDVLVADAAFGAEEVNKQRLLQVSYTLRYGHVAYMNSSANPPRLKRRISAEGVYDTKTGSLCMVACQVINGSSDCEVLVTVQFAPTDDATAREHAVGTISSLRKKSDPLFFEALDFVGGGMYVEQVEKSSSRMDTESVMLVVSIALSCAFTALQLRHVRNHPEALPATSLTMLVVLALGYAIPLVLNLEDTYGGGDDSRRRYFVKVTSGGLLELNAFVLRATTMLALALQLRLLQLAVSRRSADRAGGKNGDSSSSSPPPPPSSSEAAETERSTLWVCLPLYALGAVVVWITHTSDALPGPGQALADDLAAYAGLVLDGFLLPQVVWNALSATGARRALSPWFYAGVAAIRAAPHAYDAFRKRSYVPSRRPSYAYASTRDDLFGAGWDVAVPCGAALLVVLLFLQQRRGGSGRRGEYEMVSTPSSS